MGGVLIIGGVGVAQVGRHPGQGLQGGVGTPHPAPPVGLLRPEQGVRQAVHSAAAAVVRCCVAVAVRSQLFYTNQ